MTLRLALALLALAAPPLSAQRGWPWRPDERLIIGDFSTVQAVAASRDAVYAATENGLISYDRRFRRWQAPFTRADGFAADPVLSAAVDPTEQSLWLGTRAGLTQFRPLLRQVESVLIVGGVGELMFDQDDPVSGIYFSTRLGWRQLRRGQLMPQEVAATPPPGRRLSTPSVPDVLRRFPLVEAMAPTTLLDAQHRAHRFTSAAVTPDADEAWFGTDGLGLFRLDALAARLERLPFGLLAQPAGAVAADSAVWVGAGPGGRPGITVLDPAVQQFRYHEARPGAFESVRDILLRGGELWAATERGVAVLRPGREEQWRMLDRVSGLPSENALTLAAAPAGVWIGTDRGIARVVTPDSVIALPEPIAVLALLETRDTLWIGSTRGLMYRPGGGEDLFVPREAEPALRGPLLALAGLGDTLVAATGDRLLVRAPGSVWTALPVVSPQLGTLRALAPDSGGVWIGGERGLAFYRFAGKDLSLFRVPEDVPGAVQDLAVHGRYLWVATPEGLVRFDRRALRL